MMAFQAGVLSGALGLCVGFVIGVYRGRFLLLLEWHEYERTHVLGGPRPVLGVRVPRSMVNRVTR